MIITGFQVKDKIGRSRFFLVTFLIINTKFAMILRIFFLKFSSADISFGEKILTKRTYITNETLLNTKQIQIIDKKNFVIVVLDVHNKMFMIHIAIQKQEKK